MDFDLYSGAREQPSQHGQSYDVVMKLLEPYLFQCYHLYCDNFYTSPALFEDLFKLQVFATGTIRSTRRGIPSEVQQMKEHLEKPKILKGVQAIG